jgi:hypothetical protein
MINMPWDFMIYCFIWYFANLFVPLQRLRRSRRDSLAALKQAARLYDELDFLVCCRTM